MPELKAEELAGAEPGRGAQQYEALEPGGYLLGQRPHLLDGQGHDLLRGLEQYKRVHALAHADLGDSLAAQARADEAVAAWTQALVLMGA
ncbi:hypothetical protein GCM10017562_48970 [Streptomyces roseofulvus]